MSCNLLPASYRSMAGANLYSDKPGVLPSKGYCLGPNSPESGATMTTGMTIYVALNSDLRVVSFIPATESAF